MLGVWGGRKRDRDKREREGRKEKHLQYSNSNLESFRLFRCFVLFCFVCLFVETGSHCIAQAGLELTM